MKQTASPNAVSQKLPYKLSYAQLRRTKQPWAMPWACCSSATTSTSKLIASDVFLAIPLTMLGPTGCHIRWTGAIRILLVDHVLRLVPALIQFEAHVPRRVAIQKTNALLPCTNGQQRQEQKGLRDPLDGQSTTHGLTTKYPSKGLLGTTLYLLPLQRLELSGMQEQGCL